MEHNKDTLFERERLFTFPQLLILTPLFYGVFSCPSASDEPLLPGETEEEWEERFSRKFQQSIPDYPMLGRLWDLFMYASYKPEEVNRLRDECLKVKDSTSNEKALGGLAKLVKACDEALKRGYGLLLVPD